VLGKARLILEAFEVVDDDLSLSELVRRTGIAKASVHRLAAELVDWGVLERSGSSYRLGMRVVDLGARVPRDRLPREAAAITGRRSSGAADDHGLTLGPTRRGSDSRA